jgi:S1-C subfamily serine protease
MRSLLLAGLLGGCLLSPRAVCADEPAADHGIGAAYTQVPQTVNQLRALEKQVQAVVARVQPATIGISIGPAQGSGVIIKDGYVLTAGHVSGQPGRTVTLHLADGRKVKGKTLGRNGDIDSGLIRISDEGKWPSAEMGKSSSVKKGQWVVSIGHPGGFRPNRTPVVRLGRVLEVNGNFILTDCTLVGGDSGGPLFDLDGKVIGIHSRIGPALAQNFHVPVDTYTATWERLAKGESWGGMAGAQLVHTPGGKVVLTQKGRLTLADPLDKERKGCHHKVYTLKMGPEAIYTLDLAGKEMDGFLRLEDSTGKQLAEDDDGGGKLDARIVFRPGREDTYRIIVTTANPGENGAFTLTVRQLEITELLVRGEVDVFAALKIPRFAVPGLLRQLFMTRGPLFVTGTVLDAAGKPAADQEVEFRWARGKTTLKSNEQGLVRLRLAPGMARELALHAPREHKVLLELTDKGGKLHFFKFSPAPGKARAPTPPGTVVLDVEGRITGDDPLDRVRAGCRHKVHTFKVTPGARYTIDLESTDFDAYLRVEASDGKKLAEDDDSGGEYNARVVLRPEREDTLRIIATTCDPGQRGAYRLIIRKAALK